MSELKSLDDLVNDFPHSDASGGVLDADGQPVSGADVFLYYERRHEGLRNRLAGRTVTDANGRFHFPRAVVWEPISERRKPCFAPKYDVIARHPERGMGFTVFLENDPADNLQVSLMPMASFDVSVRDVAGNPVAGARVRLHTLWLPDPHWERRSEYISCCLQSDIGLGWHETDQGGKITVIAPGTVSFLVEKDGYARTAKWLVPDSRNHDFSARTLDFILRPSARVSGRVTDPEGQPVRGAAVWYVKMGPWNGFSRDLEVTVTDHEGRYLFDHAPCSGFEDVEIPPDYEEDDNFQVRLVSEDLRLGSDLFGVVEKLALKPGDDKIVDLKLVRGVVLTGQVIDEKTGRPVPRILLRVGRLGDVTTDDQGHFSHLFPPGEEVWIRLKPSREGDYLLDEEHSYTDLWRGRLTGDVTGLTLKAKLLPSGALNGEVIDLEGYPSQAPHTIFTPSPLPEATSEPDGRFTLKAAPTDHDFDLFALRADKQGVALVRCQAGAASVTMRMEPVRDYAGVVTTPEGAPASHLKFSLYPLADNKPIYSIRQEITTDDAGRFVAKGLLPTANYHAWWLVDEERGENPGYDDGSVIIELSKLQPGEPIAFEVRRFVNTLRGKVVDDQGYPVGGAYITVEPSEIVPRSIDNPFESDQHGGFAIGRLAAGKVKIRVSHPDFIHRKLEVGSADECVIRLKPCTDEFVARVKVLDEAGRPVPSAPVTVTLITFVAPSNQDDAETQPLPIDAEGRGEFRMHIDRKDKRRIVRRAIFCCDMPGCNLAYDALRPNDEDNEAVLRLRPSGKFWSGQVVDEEGRPIPGARVEIFGVCMGKKGDFICLDGVPGSSVITGADGRFELMGFSRARNLSLTVRAPGYIRRRERLVTEDSPPPVVLTLNRGGAVSGKVVCKATGKPWTEGCIFALPWDDDEASGESSPLAPDGSFFIDGLPPNDYWIALWQWNGEPVENRAIRHPLVKVEAGQTATAMLEVEDGVPVRGKVIDPATGAVPSGRLIVSARGREETFFYDRVTVGPDGSWLLYLAPGDYRLRCELVVRPGVEDWVGRARSIAIEKGKAYDNVVIEVK